MKSNHRSVTVDWVDPAVLDDASRRMSGMEFLHAIRDGKLPTPPIGQLLGFWLTEVGAGRVVFEFKPAEQHYNPLGAVQGGVPCAILDAAIGCSIQSVLPLGASATTLELKVNFVRPITVAAGAMRCEANTIHVGRRTATGESRLLDSQGKLYAHATSTYVILRADEER